LPPSQSCCNIWTRPQGFSAFKEMSRVPEAGTTARRHVATYCQEITRMEYLLQGRRIASDHLPAGLRRVMTLCQQVTGMCWECLEAEVRRQNVRPLLWRFVKKSRGLA